MAINDVATLGIQVTTNGAETATRSLNDLAASGDKAAQSVERVGESADEASARLKAMVRQSVEAGGTSAIQESQRSLAERLKETTAAFDTQSKAAVDWAAEQAAANARGAALNAASDRAAAQAKAAATAGFAEQQGALAKLAGQIDPTIAALDRLDAQQAKLAAFRKAGMLGTEDFNALNAAIEANRAKVGSAGKAMHKFSLNTSMTRREIGRLGADIANGNWGRFEQTSLTLANYSGILGLAFSGVGAAVLGTVAAIGLGIVAYEKGAAETEEFNKQLTLTGHIAGVTAQGLADMARNVGAATGTTQHSMSATLAEVASTGKFVGQQLQTVATAAKKLEEVTGQSIKETIKQFVSLADDPANAIVKLNAQQHFLTLAVYDQIKALQDQGQEQAASDLAMKTYAQTIGSRTPQITENLGLIEKAWKGIKGAALAAADAAMSVGRAQSDQQKFDSLSTQRDRLVGLQAKGWTYDPNLDTDSGSIQKKIDDLTAQMAKMHDARKAMDTATAAQANQQAAQDAGIKLAREADAYASAEVKRARLIAKAHGDANDAIAKAEKVQDVKLRAQLIAQAKANEQAAIAGIESHEKKPHAPRGAKSDPFASLDHLVQGAQVSSGEDTQQVKQILAIVDAGAKLIASGQSVAKVQAMVASGVAAVNEKYAKQAAVLEQQNIVAVQKYQAALDKENDALRRGIQSQIDKVSMGDKEYQREQQLNQIYTKNAEALAQLTVERNKLVAAGKDTGVIDGEIAAQQRNTAAQVKIVKSGYSAMDAAEASWQNGAIKAMENIRDEGQNVAGLTANVFTSAFNSMGDALAAFVTTGKLNFKGLVSSILSDIARMETRILASKVAGMLVSYFAGGSSASSGSSIDWSSTKWNAAGGVYTSPSLSAYSGQIVSQPTAFAFAAGAGIMGEAGPEAILPLRRGPDGKLGVAASGGGGAPTVNINIAVDNSGNASNQTTSSSDSSALAAQFADRMKSVSRQTISDEQRPGGLLWRMAHQ